MQQIGDAEQGREILAEKGGGEQQAGQRMPAESIRAAGR